MSTPSAETPTAEPVKMEVDTVDLSEVIDLDQVKKSILEKAQEYLIEQQKHVVIPLYAAWFDLNEIHSIERKLFPDFFLHEGTNGNGSTTTTATTTSTNGTAEETTSGSSYKTPQVYRDLRDFMINAYRINPVEYLTVTAVRRNLSGDVALIIRLHQFLEKWGLINYQIDPRTKPSILTPQYTGHFQITLDTPTGLVPFLPKNVKIQETGINGAAKEESKSTTDVTTVPETEVTTTTELPINLELRRNVYTKASEASKKINVNINHFVCNVCGNDCTSVRYHNLKAKSVGQAPGNAAVICISCYDEGLFPQNFYASDFVKLKESVTSTESSQWTEQEVLLLLEGIEMYCSYDTNGVNGGNTVGSNGNVQWELIAEHIGTKSKEECLIKFVQLPIEDRYLTKLVGSGSKNGTDSKNNDSNTVHDIVKEIITGDNNTTKIEENLAKKIEFVLKDQQSLISQIVELTLEKVNVKLSNIEILEKQLIQEREKASNERKQFLYERWAQYEKINKYKETNPELVTILDDLLVPVKLEVDDSNSNGVNDESKESNNGQSSKNGGDAAPVSVAQPKAYRFWSS